MNELLLAVRESNSRGEMAEVYSHHLDDRDINWSVVDSAILKRWSISGLAYIKERAWKIRGSRWNG